MKEKITLKVVRELTKEYCHLVVPAKLLIPDEILYDVVRVYQYGIMTFNTSNVFEDEIVDKLLEKSARDWSNSRKEELVRCLVVSYKYMQDPWYDSARDDYMNVVYGLQVIRLYEFGEPSTEVARIDDFGIALNKLKYSRTFSIDNSDLVLSWFYEKNKDIIDALNIIEANINSSRNGIFDASGYQHLIRDYRTLDRIDEIIKGVYNINVVMEVWNR